MMQIKNRVGMVVSWLVAGLLLAGCGPSPDTQQASPELVDAVIQQLEDSGKLDQAVQASIQKMVTEQREKQAQGRQQRQQQLTRRAAAMPAPDFANERVLGNTDAEVTLIEYSDFECPFCKRFHMTPQKVLAQFGDKVNLVFRAMPLASHGKAAFVEARAGECVASLAGEKAFWAYSNALFEHSGSNGKGIGEGETLYTLAAKQGVSKDKLDACLDDAAIQKTIDRHLASAKELGITGTPTTIVRNLKTGATEVVVGAASEASLAATVKKVLASK